MRRERQGLRGFIIKPVGAKIGAWQPLSGRSSIRLVPQDPLRKPGLCRCFPLKCAPTIAKIHSEIFPNQGLLKLSTKTESNLYNDTTRHFHLKILILFYE